MKEGEHMQKVGRDQLCHWERREQGCDKRMLSDVSGGSEVDFWAHRLLAALPFICAWDWSWSKAPDESMNHRHEHWKENNLMWESEHMKASAVILKQKADKISSNRNTMFTGVHTSNFCHVVKRFSDFLNTEELAGHITKSRSFIINSIASPNNQLLKLFISFVYYYYPIEQILL